MIIVIIVFLCLFGLQFLVYYKTKKRIKNRMEYMYVVINFISNYTVYLQKKEEIKKYKYLNDFFNLKINEMDFLLNSYSFDDIFFKKVENNDNNKKIDIKKVLEDLNESSNEINFLFNNFVKNNEVLFENARIEIFENVKIRGKIYIKMLIFIEILKKFFSGFGNIDISNIKKKEEEIICKNNFRIVY